MLCIRKTKFNNETRKINALCRLVSPEKDHGECSQLEKPVNGPKRRPILTSALWLDSGLLAWAFGSQEFT